MGVVFGEGFGECFGIDVFFLVLVYFIVCEVGVLCKCVVVFVVEGWCGDGV